MSAFYRTRVYPIVGLESRLLKGQTTCHACLRFGLEQEIVSLFTVKQLRSTLDLPKVNVANFTSKMRCDMQRNRKRGMTTSGLGTHFNADEE